MTQFYIIAVSAIVGAAISLLVLPRFLRKGATSISVNGRLEKIRELGDLVALNAYIKEVVTKESDPGFFFSLEKMILICEFEIEYRYNLKKAKVSRNQTDDSVTIELQKLKPAVHLKDFKTYDETSGKFLGVIPPFSTNPADKDNLRKLAIEKAKQDATSLGEDLIDKIEQSAENTLRTLCSNMVDGPIHIIFASHHVGEAKLEPAAAA